MFLLIMLGSIIDRSAHCASSLIIGDHLDQSFELRHWPDISVEARTARYMFDLMLILQVLCTHFVILLLQLLESLIYLA